MGNNQNEKNNEEVEETVKSLVRPKSARPKSGDMKINSISKEEKVNSDEVNKRLEKGKKYLFVSYTIKRFIVSSQ